MRQTLILFLLIALNYSCLPRDTFFTIYGEIKGIPDSTLITLYDLDQQFNFDSAYAYEGKFQFHGKVETPTIAWLRYGNEYAIIIVENTEMEFKAPLKKMHLYSEINGGQEQALQNELKKLQLPYELRASAVYDSLSGSLYEDEQQKDRLIRSFSVAQNRSQEIYVDFGLNHPNSILGMDILYRNRQKIDRDKLKAVYAAIGDHYRDSEIGRALSTYLHEELIAEGKVVPAFKAKSMEGEVLQLEDLRGNFILLTFWSAYCGPCIQQNQKYLASLEELQERVKLVHFSIDKNEEDWKIASQRDQISWYNVSDLQGPKGKVKTQYEVQGTPATFLIGPNGKLLKNLEGYNPHLDLVSEIDQVVANYQ